ncbi:MAG: hypothetical protein FWC21_05905 [Treponema sp.]|nr:hypothetical protein [Treponema sp.]
MHEMLRRVKFVKHSQKKRKITILLIIFLLLPIALSAQDEPSDDIDWENIHFDLYASGDQALVISAGVVFPLFFLDSGGNISASIIKNNKFSPVIGGTGSFAFNYYLTPRLYVGGEVGGMFNKTIADNMLYIIYLGGRVGTQLIAGRFEFPLAFSLGMSWQRYLDYGHYTMYIKPSAAAFFRATPNWAFGLTTSWFFIPQWVYEGDRGKKQRVSGKDVYGNFLDLTLSAKYQF